jgi:hypothetical protein
VRRSRGRATILAEDLDEPRSRKANPLTGTEASGGSVPIARRKEPVAEGRIPSWGPKLETIPVEASAGLVTERSRKTSPLTGTETEIHPASGSAVLPQAGSRKTNPLTGTETLLRARDDSGALERDT